MSPIKTSFALSEPSFKNVPAITIAAETFIISVIAKIPVFGFKLKIFVTGITIVENILKNPVFDRYKTKNIETNITGTNLLANLNVFSKGLFLLFLLLI